uniref:Uncharacterized protein n=2 Tax=Aegilops tauschii subsp. strangulata TaxID=200361 RepID=A0A453N3P5_AEGTS
RELPLRSARVRLDSILRPAEPPGSGSKRSTLGFSFRRGPRRPKARRRGGARTAAAMASTKVQRIMTQPINLIFRFLQSKARIQIWLFEQKDVRIEGRIIVSGF